MATSFFNGAFFDGEFFSAPTGVAAPSTGISGGGRYRYFTPAPPPLRGKKKKQIDRIIEEEHRLKQALVEYETSGADVAVLEDISKRIREIQLMILRLALESELVAQYIEWKRRLEEDEDVRFILSQL